MAIEDGAPSSEQWEIYTQDTAYVRKAQEEVEKAKELPLYKRLIDFRDANHLPKATLQIIFTNTKFLIPYKQEHLKGEKLLGVSLPFQKKELTRKVEEIRFWDGDYKNQEEKDRVFGNALPDLRMLIALGDKFYQSNSHIIGEHLATGGASLREGDRARYEAEDLSKYDLDSISLTPAKVAFRLEWGSSLVRSRPNIDTRYSAIDSDWKEIFEKAVKDQGRA